MPISLPAAPDRYRLPDPPELLIRPTAGAEVVTVDGRSLPLVSATLRGTACGGLARLVLEQRFENRHDETLHVTYRMPLPVDGAVSGYAFAIAGRTITGRVQRKQEARERFERAIAAGHTAALLEQERGDIFTQSLGNLPAREALVARIAIDQRLAWLPEGEWELRFPTVIGPRYIAATDTAEDARATQVTTAPAGVAARIQIAIAIDDPLGGRSPSSPSHALAVGVDGVVELGDVAGARLDRDIVLRWPVAGAATGMSLAMMRREAGGVGDDCYGLVTIVPPVPAARPRSFARDLIVLIDTSGSMAGLPLDKAKQLVALLIESLGDDDQLELIAFSNEPRRYRTAPIAATRGEKLAAIRWLRGLAAGGGTEMRTAVIGALHQLRPGAQRQVVIATDGYIGGEAGLVGALHAGLPASCRLHFVGVGSSVNRSLAAAMARAGRGAEVICDLDGDPERAVKRLLDRMRRPVLTDLALEGTAVVDHAPAALPDVYAGAPLVAAVQLRAGELVVRGQTCEGDWSCRLRVNPPRPGEGSGAIAALFARERIADLEARGFAGENHDAEIERTGLAFQVATRFTPFIAVDDSRSVRPAQRHEAVPQELPHGTLAASFGLRAPGEAAMRAKTLSRTMAGIVSEPLDAMAAVGSLPALDREGGADDGDDDDDLAIDYSVLGPPPAPEFSELGPPPAAEARKRMAGHGVATPPAPPATKAILLGSSPPSGGPSEPPGPRDDDAPAARRSRILRLRRKTPAMPVPVRPPGAPAPGPMGPMKTMMGSTPRPADPAGPMKTVMMSAGAPPEQPTLAAPHEPAQLQPAQLEQAGTRIVIAPDAMPVLQRSTRWRLVLLILALLAGLAALVWWLVL